MWVTSMDYSSQEIETSSKFHILIQQSCYLVVDINKVASLFIPITGESHHIKFTKIYKAEIEIESCLHKRTWSQPKAQIYQVLLLALERIASLKKNVADCN